MSWQISMLSAEGGLIMGVEALAWDWRSMMVFRALLGIFEAAFGPGEVLMLSIEFEK